MTSGLLASPPSIQTVRLVAGDGGTFVVLSADGALPSPKVGVLTDPPRIYLDFPGVATVTRGTRDAGNPTVRGVRVAINQSDPLVTRVVIDLASPAPHRIEEDRRASGEITVVVGIAVAPPAAVKPRPGGKDAAPPKPPKTTPAAPATAASAPRPPQGAEPAPPPRAAPEPLHTFIPTLQTVRLIDVGDGRASVILSADGGLPSPQVGVLTDPPGISLDLPGVTAATEGLQVNGSLLVLGVRVATSQSKPPVTRVVIDLANPVPHRIEADRRASGQITVVVTVPTAPTETPASAAPVNIPAAAAPMPAAAPAPPPAPPAVEPATRPARSPELARAARATGRRVPLTDAARYLQRASSLIDRLERLRPVLVALDALGALPEARLKSAAEELRSIHQGLTKIVPSRTLAGAHELLREACVLGAASMAARVGATAPDDTARAWNAAAAAAGALMLMDQARDEVGLAPAHPDSM